MKKIITTVFCVFTIGFGIAQNVGINTTGALPDASAALDIDYPDKGLLIPRVALQSTTDITTIPSPATSLLVFNTNTAMAGGSVGFWYWDGTQWVQAIGPQGPAGPAGTNGVDGLNCWDLDGDGVQDPSEDVNGDGVWDAQDCQGPTGPQGPAGANGTDGLNCWDLDGDGVQDPSEDINGDGVWDAQDCQGATGPQGPAGADGLNCWDLDGDGVQDPSEDINGDGVWDAQDCQGPAGVTLKTGYSLTTSRTISSASWSTVSGVSVSFVAITSDAIINFSVSGYGYTNSMAFVQFRILNNGAPIGSTNTKIQSYDDVTGTITPWSCSFTKYITGLTVGSTYTITIQGLVGGIYGTYDAVIDPSVDGHHMNITVMQ